MTKVKKGGTKFLMSLFLVFCGVMGVFFGGNVYADESSGSFKIYAWAQTCQTLDGEVVQGSCSSGSGNIVSSSEVVRGSDGKYSIKEEQKSESIEVKIEGNELVVSPSCAMFNDCSQLAVKVPLNDDIDAMRSSVTSALRSANWNHVDNCVGTASGASCFTTQYTFSTTDVTKTEAVEMPEEDLAGTLAGEDTEGAKSESNCMNSGAGESLGWVICPILSVLSGAADTIYDDFVDPALRVNPQLFTYSDDEGGSATRQGWEIFRGFANAIFILLLIVVIFSQLTGIGIDNYGIKKILPKIIVAAILINLSYWICLLFVDLSDVIGNAMQRLLNGMADAIEMPNNIGGISLGGVTFGLVTGAGILGVLAGGIWSSGLMAGGGMGILVMLVTSAISIVVALLFLFLLLAAREAAIVVLTMIAPVAIVCYMLPNTKNYFDRWLKLGGGLLLVYPICGLLVGGGNFVSKVLLAAGAGEEGFFSAFVAMIVGIVPIFFIPMVLRNSFQAAGNLGARITNMGQRLGNRASGAVGNAMRGSEGYKNYQNELGRRRQESAAERTINRLNKRRERRGSLGEADARRLAQASEVRDRLSRENRAARTILAGNDYSGEGIDQLMSRWENAFKSGDGESLDAITNVMSQRYGAMAAGKIGQSLEGMTGVANNANYQASLKTLQRTMNENSTLAGQMRGKASDAFQMINDAGMRWDDQHVNEDGSRGAMVYQDLDWFTENNGTSTSLGDWSTQSGATLRRALNSGKLTTEQVEQLLNSTDPAIQSGIQSDSDKRNILQAHLYNMDPANAGQNLTEAQAAERYRASQQSAQQAIQQAQQNQQEQIAQNLQDINDILRQQHGGGGNPPVPNPPVPNP